MEVVPEQRFLFAELGMGEDEDVLEWQLSPRAAPICVWSTEGEDDAAAATAAGSGRSCTFLILRRCVAMHAHTMHAHTLSVFSLPSLSPPCMPLP